MPQSVEQIYAGIARINDEHTRRVLYLQFVERYFPEAFKAIIALTSTPIESPSIR